MTSATVSPFSTPHSPLFPARSILIPPQFPPAPLRGMMMMLTTRSRKNLTLTTTTTTNTSLLPPLVLVAVVHKPRRAQRLRLRPRLMPRARARLQPGAPSETSLLLHPGHPAALPGLPLLLSRIVRIVVMQSLPTPSPFTRLLHAVISSSTTRRSGKSRLHLVILVANYVSMYIGGPRISRDTWGAMPTSRFSVLADWMFRMARRVNSREESLKVVDGG